MEWSKVAKKVTAEIAKQCDPFEPVHIWC